jgi:hypothetical protein
VTELFLGDNQEVHDNHRTFFPVGRTILGMAARLNSAWLQGHSAAPSDCETGNLGCIFLGKSMCYGLENKVVFILTMLCNRLQKETIAGSYFHKQTALLFREF